MIGLRTALLLYAALALIALATLHKQMLYLALIIVGALAVKSALHAYREQLSADAHTVVEVKQDNPGEDQTG